MQQHHPAFLVDIEKHASNAILGQACPNLLDTVAQWLANGHPDKPAKFHRLDVLADPFTVIG